MKTKAATLADVARHANVSYQTVSRVLNNSANVSAKTRKKIELAIAELKYVPNRVAQQLVGKESKTLGLVTTSLALHAPSQIAAAVKKYASEQGYQVLISMIDDGSDSSIQYAINELKSQRVERMIINARSKRRWRKAWSMRTRTWSACSSTLTPTARCSTLPLTQPRVRGPA
ncbi:Lactose operon repressor [Kluyvera intermedia]|nr:Lactose operon repressor [Kluyvera intermedia]